jgi:transcriptional regulator with XRE-family HTH domain
MKNNLRAQRNKNNFSVRQLSEISGVSITHISFIENDKTTPTITIARKLANALNASVDELFPEPNTETKTTLSA